MISIDGLTRSNGRVSNAGKCKTFLVAAKALNPKVNRSASAEVGTPMSIVDLALLRASA
jgi:hypothetical protein